MPNEKVMTIYISAQILSLIIDFSNKEGWEKTESAAYMDEEKCKYELG
jgi:hypothetical protein